MIRRVAILTATVAAGATLAVVSLGGMFGVPGADAATLTCNAALGPWNGDSADKGKRDAARLGPESRAIVAEIISIGGQRQISPRGWQIAIQAGMTESGLRNLDYGDADSVGIFQMRTSMGWGTPEQLADVPYQINKFYDVMLNVADWETRRPGDVAQAVERSAFPDRYHNWEAMAAFLVSEGGQVLDPTGCGGSGSGGPIADIVIAFAKEQLGEPYLWGGNGPDAWDCSGIVLAAYKKAGIAVPRVADAQYAAGRHYPLAEAQPGDLVFWSDSAGNPGPAIHHVAIYLGDNKVIHAPQTGDVVKISTIWPTELVHTVTRPGT